ncbi:MAG: YdcF family protein, partial [Pseudomonadota bacterium]
MYGLVLSVGHYRKIREFPVTAWSEDHRADCGIVLTGGPSRIADAFDQLYLQRIKKVIISGVNPATQLREIFPQRVFFGGLDRGDIILEKRSLTTYGNALQALPLVEALNCKDVVLMTSKLHMHRAFSTFRAYFPEDIPIYKRATVGKRFQPHWTRVWSETLKTVFYDLWFFG